MTIASTALKAVSEAIIAWFIEMVWPEIKKLLERIIKIVFEWLFEKIRIYFEEAAKQEEKEFSEKAEESAKKAGEATAEVEIEKYKAEAKVWRQAFEMLKAKNQLMEPVLSRFMAEGISKANKSVASLEVGDIFEISAEEIKLKPDVMPMLLPQDGKK